MIDSFALPKMYPSAIVYLYSSQRLERYISFLSGMSLPCPLSNGIQTRVKNNLCHLVGQRRFLSLYSLSYRCNVQDCYTNSISRVTNLESLVPQLKTFTVRTTHVAVTKTKHPRFIYVTNGKQCSTHIFLKNIYFEKNSLA